MLSFRHRARWNNASTILLLEAVVAPGLSSRLWPILLRLILIVNIDVAYGEEEYCDKA